MAGIVYMDTSALVALIVAEPHSAAVGSWYERSAATLVSAAWCVPEFASALAMKQRTGHLSEAQAAQAWERFERLIASDLALVPVGQESFHRAALLTLDAASGLRAGDALHLACAEAAGAKQMATLDAMQARGAAKLKIKALAFG
jgi:predicted nucleic acid-binding protein